MKLFLTTASAIALLSATAAFGQTYEANSGGQTSSAATSGDLVAGEATVAGEVAKAVAANSLIPTVNQLIASAEVGNTVIASVGGNEVGPANMGSASVSPAGEGPWNQNVQFTLGDDNNAVNLQMGTYNESATLQIGDENKALVYQNGIGHEAAIAQVGDDNEAAALQWGADHGAAMAQAGDHNTSFGVQKGGALNNPAGNFLAHAQLGEYNSALTYQDGIANTAATVQAGDRNESFIAQAAVLITSFSETVNGHTFEGSLPTGANVSTTGTLTANNNAAASLQIGTDHKSAIVQMGSNNQTVNFQTQ